MGPDEQKLREMILFLSERCATRPGFGSSQLNRALFYSDFLAYAELGHPISGMEYVRLPQGPAPRGLRSVREGMIKTGELALQVIGLPDGTQQHRTANLRRPNLKLFTGEEVSIMGRALDALAQTDEETAGALRHLEIGWRTARDGEAIPYGTVLISAEPLSDQAIQRAQRIAHQHGFVATPA